MRYFVLFLAVLFGLFVAINSVYASDKGTGSAMATCIEDIWECGEWAQQCDTSGKQHRACSLVKDCLRVETPVPETERDCSKLQCGKKSTLKARIECRLNLSKEALAREFAIQYLPEECRAIKKRVVQTACVNRYKALQPCLAKQEVKERFQCARDVFKLGHMLSEEVKTCKSKKGKEQATCKTAVRERVFSMVKFSLYDLSEQAGKLRAKGVPVKIIVGFVQSMEMLQQKFNSASSASSRRAIVAKAQTEWKQFIVRVEKIEKNLTDGLGGDNLDAAIQDLKAVE